MNFVRGDTFYISRYIEDKEGNKLILDKKKDELNFTVRRNVESEILIEKHIEDIEISEDGKYKITLNPSDTENLDFGSYGYDIEIRIGKAEEEPFVRTVENGKLKLLEYDYSRPEK